MYKKGLSLVEIIVVVTIIAILALVVTLQLSRQGEDARDIRRTTRFLDAYRIAEQTYNSYLLDGNVPPAVTPAAPRVYTGNDLTGILNNANNKFPDGESLNFNGAAFDSVTIEPNTFNVTGINSDDNTNTWNFYYLIDAEGMLESILVVNDGFFAIDGGELNN